MVDLPFSSHLKASSVLNVWVMKVGQNLHEFTIQHCPQRIQNAHYHSNIIIIYYRNETDSKEQSLQSIFKIKTEPLSEFFTEPMYEGWSKRITSSLVLTFLVKT